jgi:predicted DNA binding protein
MATIAEITLPAEEFALAKTLAAIDGIEFEVERVVAHDSERVMPFVWASGASLDDVEAALRTDPTVDQVEVLASLDDEQLYRMDWIDHIQMLARILVVEDATIMAASTAHNKWHLRTLFPEREALSRMYEFGQDAGLDFDVHRIYRLDEHRQGRFGLTDKQQETLAAAFEDGYYEIPREVSAQELAATIGISHQALSEQLRRAHGSLVRNAIVIGHSDENRTNR